MNQFSLEGKNALVVGGSKGIGNGMAMGLARAGATVVLSSRTQADLDVAAREMTEATGAKTMGIAADISSLAGVNGLVAKAVEAVGHIDILINSAGVNVRKGCLEFTEEDWDLVQNVQLKYVFFMCQAVARHMTEKGIKGSIINVASISSVIGLWNMVAYCTAKGGITQMTKAMAVELAARGVRVNAMCPGYTATEMTKPLFNDPAKVEDMMRRIPAKRFGVPEDYAGIAAFLASDASDYLTGQMIILDGGWLAS